MSYSLKTSAKKHNSSHTRVKFWYYQPKLPKFHRFYLSEPTLDAILLHHIQKNDFYR